MFGLKKEQLQTLRPVDALTIACAIFLSALTLMFASRVHEWVYLVPINLLASFGLLALAKSDSSSERRVLRFIHNWYPVPVIFLVFKEVYVIIHSLGWSDWDSLLIEADRAVFGLDPTVWLAQFSSPVLTEVLQVAYVSYYFIMLTLGIEVYFRKERHDFSFVIFTITYGFFLSYLGYIAFPAVGPRFTLHAFDSLSRDLPGLYVTDALRNFINSGESIPRDVVNPIAFAQRDAFPSGHAQMTLIVMFLAQRYRLKSRWALHAMGTLLIISTVYLRYHYVVDLFGGAIFMLFTVWTAPKIFNWWEEQLVPKLRL
ncbi:MAG: phosphatase PAP2 family protein [Ignavibacteriae bacterium]|nr:phosphatase PAP2 family protein [Ignavibacteria bacterium]MBI3364291.1 phosphatase PAP2 family protein [Ignavibacteriota bacterium]